MLLLDLLSLAALAPAWHLAGRATQRLQLPAITGIMLVSPLLARPLLCAVVVYKQLRTELSRSTGSCAT